MSMAEFLNISIHETVQSMAESPRLSTERHRRSQYEEMQDFTIHPHKIVNRVIKNKAADDVSCKKSYLARKPFVTEILGIRKHIEYQRL